MIIVAVLLLAGFYVGWNIGANDAANCIGTSVGSGIISYRRAIVLMALFVIAGAVLQGHYVTKTIGKGIIQTKLPDLAILVALLSSGLFVTLATFFKIPVSTSQSIVGGVLGVGIGTLGFQSQYIQYAVLKKILLCWVLCPILTLVLSSLLYLILITFLRRVKRVPLWNRIISLAAILSACYVAYSLGANDVGNAIGPLLNKYPDKGLWLAILGGLALATGALTFGRRVTETIGKNITVLDIPGAFAAQASAGFGVHLFSVLGIPVSTSQAIVGAVVGIGLAKGLKTVSVLQIRRIAIGWVATPTCAATFSCLLYKLLHGIIF
ncbi:inorganic phosphate transporter family protein [bacterium]|nr:inorganic phosphate transporter family protein [bacterium]MBU4561404.1 inorganic phosphate transporter family protein [bacterium]